MQRCTTGANANKAGEALCHLEKRIRACRICRDDPMGKVLPHEPRPVLQVSSSARLAICGQAPGTRVHASGRPFTDPSGDRLRRWLGLTPELFYDERLVAIVPMGFCFPGLDPKGGDLSPRRECAPAWRDLVFDLMPNLEVMVLVGYYAQRWHLGDNCCESLTATVKAWETIRELQVNPTLYPTPHPSWRNNGWLRTHPWFEVELIPALQAHIKLIVDR